MKFLKGFLTAILGFVMLMSLTTFCSVFLLRSLLSGPNLAKIMTSVAQKTDTLDISKFTNSDVKIELDEVDKEFLEKDAMEVYGDLISQILEYEMGTRDTLPDTTKLKEKMKDLAEDYEKKTGKEVDISELEKGIDEAIEQYGKETKNEPILNEDIKKVFSVIFSNTLLIASIIVFVVCAILIVVINKSILPLLKHLIIILIINGVGNGLLSKALSSVVKDNSEVGVVLVDNISGLINNVLIISIICAAVLIIAYIAIKIILKKKKEVPVIENIVEVNNQPIESTPIETPEEPEQLEEIDNNEK